MLFVEGSEAACVEMIARLRALSWQAMAVRGEWRLASDDALALPATFCEFAETGMGEIFTLARLVGLEDECRALLMKLPPTAASADASAAPAAAAGTSSRGVHAAACGAGGGSGARAPPPGHGTSGREAPACVTWVLPPPAKKERAGAGAGAGAGGGGERGGGAAGAGAGAAGGAVHIEVRVRTNAPSSAVTAVTEECVCVDLAAPPRDGAANAELARTVAAALRVPASACAVVLGGKARSKVVRVEPGAVACLRDAVEALYVAADGR